MKLFDTILLSFSAALLLIGIYELYEFGLGHAYWSLMLSLIAFFAYIYRKRR
jgi:hypothetical protein